MEALTIAPTNYVLPVCMCSLTFIQNSSSLLNELNPIHLSIQASFLLGKLLSTSSLG